MDKQKVLDDIKKTSRILCQLDDLEKRRRLTAQELSTRAELEGALEASKLAIADDRVTVEGPRIGASGSGPFRNLGAQLYAVAQAGTPGGQIDPRLYTAAAASGLNETVPSDGGFFVQTDYSNELLEGLIETNKLWKLCRRIPISGNANSIKINGIDETSRASTRWGGIVGYWASEAELKTKSKPKFRQIELNLKKLVGLCYTSDELMMDAPALESVIRTGFISEFAFLVDDSIINGTGAGQPLGILNSGCLVSVSKETGQKAATIVAENVIKMYSRALNPESSVWLINQNVQPQLFTMSIAVGTGGAPIFMPAGGLSGQPYNTLLGRPVIPIEQAATLGTAGDIIFADLANGYIIAEKGGIQADMSIHVRFVYDESCFRFVLRLDGSPVRATALTPYKGSSADTQSHFVALETRS